MTDFFDQAINKAKTEYGKTGEGGGNTEWYKLEEGDNKVRILSMPEAYGQHYTPAGYKGICIGKLHGCPGCKEADAEPDQKKKNKVSVKYIVWVLDKKDETIKLFRASYTIIQQLQALASNEEYAFTEMPMPYDVTINAKNAGTTEVKYNVVAARSNTPVSDEILAKLAEEKPLSEIKEKIKEKKMNELGVKYHNPQDDDTPPTDPGYDESNIYDGVDEQ